MTDAEKDAGDEGTRDKSNIHALLSLFFGRPRVLRWLRARMLVLLIVTDRERLQGMWGLVSMTPGGKAADAPIMPEDSAVKYVFQSPRLTCLPTGGSPENSCRCSASPARCGLAQPLRWTFGIDILQTNRNWFVRSQ